MREFAKPSTPRRKVNEMSTRSSLFYDSETYIHLYEDLGDEANARYLYLQDSQGNVVAIPSDIWERLSEIKPPKDMATTRKNPASRYYEQSS